MHKLKLSGYKVNERIDILKSGTLGYLRMVERENNGHTPVNRDSRKGRERKRAEKILAKTNWFKENEEGLEEEQPQHIKVKWAASNNRNKCKKSKTKTRNN